MWWRTTAIEAVVRAARTKTRTTVVALNGARVAKRETRVRKVATVEALEGLVMLSTVWAIWGATSETRRILEHFLVGEHRAGSGERDRRNFGIAGSMESDTVTAAISG